jgi:homoserine O-acetyltransferase
MFKRLTAFILLLTAAVPVAVAADAPIQPLVAREATTILRNFRFADGETIGALKLHYRTLGTPHRDANGAINNAVLLLHSSGSTGAAFLRAQFAGELFGAGQPLDARRFFLIMPDAIGHGGSAKPSDALHARFPHFGYDDVVIAEHAMLAQALGITHLRLVLGTSLGCGSTFLWATRFPGDADAYLPLACIPDQIAGQNRVWRKAAIEAIKADPAWRGGEYAAPPPMGMRAALSLQMIAAGIGPRAMWRDNPTRAVADAYFDKRLATDLAAIDANDLIYQLEASAQYDPSADLGRVAAPMTWINFADDAINLPGSKMVVDLAARIPGVRLVLIPATEETRGHSTHSLPRFWKTELIELLARSAPAGGAR